MKAFLLILTLVLTVNFSTAQVNKDCISIIETNLSFSPTNVEEIKHLDDKIVISSEKDGKKYVLSIGLSNTFEFVKHIEVGARISISYKDGKRLINVARREGNMVTVRRFNICNAIIHK